MQIGPPTRSICATRTAPISPVWSCWRSWRMTTRLPMPSAKVAFKTAEDSALGSFGLSAGEVRRIYLEVSDLTDHGVFTGTMILRKPGAQVEESHQC